MACLNESASREKNCTESELNRTCSTDSSLIAEQDRTRYETCRLHSRTAKLMIAKVSQAIKTYVNLAISIFQNIVIQSEVGRAGKNRQRQIRNFNARNTAEDP